jgi:hypothetical protein
MRNIRKKRKKERDNQGKQQKEMVEDQRAYQTAKPLKEGKKKPQKITSSGMVKFQS